MSVPANFFDTYDVVASPTDDAETVIAILGGVGELLPGLSVHLHGWVDLTPGAAATNVVLAVHRTDLNGDLVGQPAGPAYTPADTLATVTFGIDVVDFPGDFAGATYVLVATVDGTVVPSTVNQVHLGARTC